MRLAQESIPAPHRLSEGIRIDRSGSSRWKVTAGLWLPRPLEEVFSFFSAAENLNLITPNWVYFRILTPLPVKMEVGARIDYVIRLRGIPVAWKTEITAWEPGVRFIDEQRSGPYREWIHEHTFQTMDGGTWCGDTVHYRPPGGSLVNRLFVQPDVHKIFAYRHQAMKRIFNSSALPAASSSAGIPV